VTLPRRRASTSHPHGVESKLLQQILETHQRIAQVRNQVGSVEPRCSKRSKTQWKDTSFRCKDLSCGPRVSGNMHAGHHCRTLLGNVTLTS
jgi:hypothetical protein